MKTKTRLYLSLSLVFCMMVSPLNPVISNNKDVVTVKEITQEEFNNYDLSGWDSSNSKNEIDMVLPTQSPKSNNNVDKLNENNSKLTRVSLINQIPDFYPTLLVNHDTITIKEILETEFNNYDLSD